MTLAVPVSPERNRLLDQQHLVVDHVSWTLYERILEEIGDRQLRVTFHRGRMEIMAPLAEHEFPTGAIARLLEAMTVELDIDLAKLRSTTFRREDAQAGLEPDECYYLKNADRIRGMKRFDPAIYPPPDLAIEIDITSRSIARQPIYAALGVPELWRFDGSKITVLLLQGSTYRPVEKSPTFPFLPMDQFTRFVHRMVEESQTAVIREFQLWVRTLRTK